MHTKRSNKTKMSHMRFTIQPFLFPKFELSDVFSLSHSLGNSAVFVLVLRIISTTGRKV